MSVTTYEDDRTIITVRVPNRAPVLAWSEASVRRGDTTIAVSTSITAPRAVVATIPAAALTPGSWQIQIRAGDTEPNAQTVFDGAISVKDSI